MPANHLVASMARSYKMALPLCELHEKRENQSSRVFSWKHKRSTAFSMIISLKKERSGYIHGMRQFARLPARLHAL